MRLRFLVLILLALCALTAFGAQTPSPRQRAVSAERQLRELRTSTSKQRTFGLDAARSGVSLKVQRGVATGSTDRKSTRLNSSH